MSDKRKMTPEGESKRIGSNDRLGIGFSVSIGTRYLNESEYRLDGDTLVIDVGPNPGEQLKVHLQSSGKFA